MGAVTWWCAGPKDTPYEGGTYLIDIELGRRDTSWDEPLYRAVYYYCRAITPSALPHVKVNVDDSQCAPVTFNVIASLNVGVRRQRKLWG